MNLRNIRIVYGKELLDSLRDRRTLISMIVVPVFVMPLLMLGFGLTAAVVVNREHKQTARIMVLGAEHSPQTAAGLEQLPRIEILPPRPDYADLIANREIRAAVEIPPGFDKALEEAKPARVQIYVHLGDMKSGFAADTLESYFRDLREATVRERLAARSLPETFVRPFDIRQENVAPPEKVAASLFGGLIPYVVILLSLIGAMYPAMDLTAGEKERGTIETILCSPVSRTHLVLGKFLMVLTASLATVVLSLASMAGSFLLAARFLFEPGQIADFALTVAPQAVLAVFAMILPIAVFFSAALLAISLFAKSFKEAQTYISPLMVIVIVPAMFALLPGVELNLTLSLIPILNTSLVSREILSGVYPWTFIAIIFLTSCLYAALALAAAVWLFQRENVLFRS
jgi:sodium transport system permease protein